MLRERCSATSEAQQFASMWGESQIDELWFCHDDELWLSQ